MSAFQGGNNNASYMQTQGGLNSHFGGTPLNAGSNNLKNILDETHKGSRPFI